jgi:DNA-binding NarL/FixJ family response regulator
MESKPIRLIIVDDHEIVLRTLRRYLDSLPAFEVVGTAPDGIAALQVIADVAADVILMDVELPQLGGIEVTRRVTAAQLGAKVIMMTRFTDDATVESSVLAGAMGFVPKLSNLEDLIAAIESVQSGRPYYSASVCAPILKGYKDGLVKSSYASDRRPLLSARETDVLHLFAEGNTLKTIADALSISPRTVESHIARVKNKLGIDTLAGLVKYAIKHRITLLDPMEPEPSATSSRRSGHDG